jgi:hypothetical protein
MFMSFLQMTKLVIRAKQDLPGTEGERGGRKRGETGWRNDPNNV